MANDRSPDEERPLSATSEPVPEADALEQAATVAPEEEDDVLSEGDDVPEADAIEQARVAPLEDEEHS
jgi:hypothetical protein